MWLRVIWSFFSPRERRRCLLLTAAMCLGAGLEAVGVGLIFPFIAALNDPELAFRSPVAGPVLSALGVANARELLIASGLTLIAFYVLKGGYLSAVYYSLYGFIFRKQVDLAQRLFGGYLDAPYVFHLQRNSSELVKNTAESTLRFAVGVLQPLVIVASEGLVTTALIFLLLVLSPEATLAALVALGLPSILFYRALSKRLSWMGRENERHQALIFQWINQGIAGIKETKVLGAKRYFLNRHAAHASFFAAAFSSFTFFAHLPHILMQVVAALGLVVVAVVLFPAEDGVSILPFLGMFAMASVRLMPSANRILHSLASLRFHFAAADVLYGELGELRRQREQGSIPTPSSGPAGPITFKRALALDNLSYRYPTGEAQAVNGISLVIPKNTSVAFVGPTGSGKSTLLSLILGLLTPSEGRILVDDRDIWDDPMAWQRRIGYIPQMVFLSDDTIRRNVAFAVSDEEIDDDRVWTALRLAQLDAVVRALPDGLDAIVGERGERFSGGERQRLGIARALYRDPEVLVMDEVTASLDHDTEAALVRALNTLKGRKTVLIVAHRMEMVKDCDCLYMLSGGALAASGTYDGLLRGNVDFRRLAGSTV